ncbi:hypothetical protein IAT38_006606 [Cryptococcus sp. DSM 104549]
MNITIDDVSPQFQYITANASTVGWMQDHTADPLVGRYFRSTFYGTANEGDSARLKFNGSAVTIYGAKRLNHGAYSTQLDGGNPEYRLGYSAADQFQQVLYHAEGLATDVEHEVILTNMPSRTSPPEGSNITEWWLDIDYAVITTSTSTTDKIYTTAYDDTSSAVQYFGLGWARGPPLSPQLYYNTTAHISAIVGDSLELSFNGSSVQVFGGMYMDHGNYSISIDNQPAQSFDGSYFELQTGVSLYQASGLVDGPHKLVLTNIGQNAAGTFVDFDYAVVNSTIDPTTPSITADGSTTNIPNLPITSPADSSASALVAGSGNGSQSKSNSGAIVGGAVGGVVGLALLVLLLWFWMRRRREHRLETDGFSRPGRAEAVDLSGGEVKPFEYSGGRGLSAFTTSTLPVLSSGSAPSAPSSQSRESSYAPVLGHSPVDGPAAAYRIPQPGGEPYLSRVPAPPPSNATSYSRSVPAPASSSSGSASASRNGSQPPASEGYTSFAASFSPTATAEKSAASRHSASTSQGSFGRMYVHGREMDVGPLGPMSEASSEWRHEVLPPDYTQATEPLPGQRRGSD